MKEDCMLETKEASSPSSLAIRTLKKIQEEDREPSPLERLLRYLLREKFHDLAKQLSADLIAAVELRWNPAHRVSHMDLQVLADELHLLMLRQELLLLPPRGLEKDNEYQSLRPNRLSGSSTALSRPVSPTTPSRIPPTSSPPARKRSSVETSTRSAPSRKSRKKTAPPATRKKPSSSATRGGAVSRNHSA